MKFSYYDYRRERFYPLPVLPFSVTLSNSFPSFLLKMRNCFITCLLDSLTFYYMSFARPWPLYNLFPNVQCPNWTSENWTIAVICVDEAARAYQQITTVTFWQLRDVCPSPHCFKNRKLWGNFKLFMKNMELKCNLFWCKTILKSMHRLFIRCIFYELFLTLSVGSIFKVF